MLDNVKITFGIIVLNGEPFTKYCLRSIYPFAHEIIVVEGGSKKAIDQAPEGHSIDGTLEALQEFKEQEDPENKVQIITHDGFWEEKTEQSQAFAKRATGDYIWQVDIDEFYKPEDIQKVIELLKSDPSITAVSFNTINFWGSFNSVLDGWVYRMNNTGEFHRLFKFGNGFTYQEHRPPTVHNPFGRCTRSINWKRGSELAKKGIFIYHYSFVYPDQVLNKMRYYDRHDHSTERSIWYKTNYQKITRPFHIYHDQTLPSWLYRFKGTHPKEIINLICSMENNDSIAETQLEYDINILLNSLWYQVTVLILKVLSKPVTWIYKIRMFYLMVKKLPSRMV